MNSSLNNLTNSRLAEPCRIIGVLDDGAASLTPTALKHIEAADLVIGSRRTLALLITHCAPLAEQRELTGQLLQVPEWIQGAFISALIWQLLLASILFTRLITQMRSGSAND